ncbi:MAG TPA: PspC domain-containing protein, partial [Solirubrobacteraceae bacterium]|nr:PspC domain-containing protein [Solirubrobacteraceae bacterium]
PRRFERSSSDRMIAGVCGGLGRLFGIDATLVRIAFVALALLGGTGLVMYAAALVLVPSDDAADGAPASGRDRALVAAAAIALLIAGVGLGLFGGVGFGNALGPVAFLALAGLAVWWLATGERPGGTPGAVLRRALIGFALLVACSVLAVGSFLASGLGGGAVVAGLVIAAGAGLVTAAFVGGARWLVLPALAVALPLAFVSAAGIDLDGGFGERHERPAAFADLQSGYRLGAGKLVVDLRDLELPPGDHRVSIGVGVGHALVLVREDVCVASRASVGMGGVAIFNRNGGGIDVDWSDDRRAPPATPRLVVEGDVGMGLLEVRHRDDVLHGPGLRFDREAERNAACATTAASARSAGAPGG